MSFLKAGPVKRSHKIVIVNAVFLGNVRAVALGIFSPALHFTPLHFVFASIGFRNSGFCTLQPQK